MPNREKLPETKYTRFIRDFGKPTESLYLAMDFLKYSKGTRTDAKPIYKALMQYPRYQRLYNNDKQGFYDIMRGVQIVNFNYLNAVIHFFCGGTDKNYGVFDYNRNSGKLRYILKPYGQRYINKNGNWNTVQGSHQQVMSTMSSPKGLYTPEHGEHPAYKIFGNTFNTIFNPDIMLYKDRMTPDKIVQTKANYKNEIPSTQLPTNDDKEGKIRHLRYLMSHFLLNAFNTPERYALFLAFLISEKQTGYNGFFTWKKYTERGFDAWKYEFQKQAMKLIDEHEKEYQNQQFQQQMQYQDKHVITPIQQHEANPQPINSTPQQASQVAKWLDMMDESKMNSIIKEAIHKYINNKSYLS